MVAASERQAERDRPSERIARIRRRYQTGDAWLSIQRARLFTEEWRRTESAGLSRAMRVALSMRNVYQNMPVYLDPDDRIAGAWTEFFLGVPIPIERGEYNTVLEAELTRPRMLAHRARSAARAASYMVRKRALGEFVRNQRRVRAKGAQPLNMGLQTMSVREINRFRIRDADRRALLGDLLPYWHGRSLADVLQAELLSAGLYSRDMADFVMAVPGATSRQIAWITSCATIATIQGHVILDYDRVLAVGLDRMKRDVAALLDGADGSSADEVDFLRSIRVALDGAATFATRVADRVESELDRETDGERKQVLARLLADCRTVPHRPPESFRQAVQAMWTIKTAVEIAHPINLHSFGRLDQNLIEFYRRDAAAGRVTRAEARELLEELLLKVMSQNVRPESNVLSNFYHRFLGSTPVTVGGLTRAGDDATNELTELLVEAADRSRAVTNLTVRVHKKTPDALLFKVAGALADGASCFSLFSDETTVEAMRRRGFADEDANDYAVVGCVEAVCPGKTGSMSASAVQLSHLLDLALRNGDAKTLAGTLAGDGPRTGDPSTFADFEQLLQAFFSQARHAIEKTATGSNLRDRLHAERLPAPCISAFMGGCLESAKDVTAGGAHYDLAGISLINSIANAVDSLYAIKKLAFDEPRYTVRQILDAVDADFVGFDEIARDIRGLPGMWGNGDPETDDLARRVAETLFGEVLAHRTFKNAPFVVYIISMTTHTIDGRLSPATPDGRPAATPFAASCNPANVDRAGATAVLRSVASLPFEDVLGSAVNVKFHPTAIGRTDQSRAKWVGLIRAYFAMGGQQIQPTVVSGEMLREARAHPEQHRDLIVKVGGYSTYFTELGREIQDEVIARTEHR